MERVTEVLEPLTKPRFPRAWIEPLDGKPPRSPRRRVQWWRLFMVMAVVVGVNVVLMERMTSPPGEVAPRYQYWVEGMVERLQHAPSGSAMITMVSATGRALTAALDFGQTAVFYQWGGVGSTAHLKLGQRILMLQERGLAKSIEILPQLPLPKASVYGGGPVR